MRSSFFLKFLYLTILISCGVNTGNPIGGGETSPKPKATLMLRMPSLAEKASLSMHITGVQLTGRKNKVVIPTEEVLNVRSGERVKLFSNTVIPSDTYQEIKLLLLEKKPVSYFTQAGQEVPVHVPPRSILKKSSNLSLGQVSKSCDDDQELCQNLYSIVLRNKKKKFTIAKNEARVLTINFDFSQQISEVEDANPKIKEHFKSQGLDEDSLVFSPFIDNFSFGETEFTEICDDCEDDFEEDFSNIDPRNDLWWEDQASSDEDHQDIEDLNEDEFEDVWEDEDIYDDDVFDELDFESDDDDDDSSDSLDSDWHSDLNSSSMTSVAIFNQALDQVDRICVYDMQDEARSIDGDAFACEDALAEGRASIARPIILDLEVATYEIILLDNDFEIVKTLYFEIEETSQSYDIVLDADLELTIFETDDFGYEYEPDGEMDFQRF